jgi:hypothetical protein
VRWSLLIELSRAAEGNHWLTLLVFFNRRVDILIFNGHIAGIIGAMNKSLRVRGDTETFLAIAAPGAYRAIFFLGTHKQILFQIKSTLINFAQSNFLVTRRKSL